MILSKFYDSIRNTFTLTDSNVKGFDFILSEAEKRLVPTNDLAYILSTVWHETASTMRPIAEYGKGKGKKYGVKDRNGQIPYGRGYVQLTWADNYEKADKELNLNGALIKNYDLAMDPNYAVQILFKGMAEGWFTGKSLDTYIDALDESDGEDLKEYVGARRIINGTDKAALLGNYAIAFERALRASGYGKATSLPETLKNEPVTIPEPMEPIVEPVKPATEVVLTLRRQDLDKITLLELYQALSGLIGSTK